jgi:hypothetical protein
MVAFYYQFSSLSNSTELQLTRDLVLAFILSLLVRGGGESLPRSGAYTFPLFRSNAPNERCISLEKTLAPIDSKIYKFSSVMRLGSSSRNSNQSQFTLKGPSRFVIIQTSAEATTLGGCQKKAFTIYSAFQFPFTRCR